MTGQQHSKRAQDVRNDCPAAGLVSTEAPLGSELGLASLSSGPSMQELDPHELGIGLRLEDPKTFRPEDDLKNVTA